MNDESDQRISTQKAVFMVIIALLFDLVQLGTGILALSGATLVVGTGAVAGEAVAGEAGAAVGTTVATIVLWLPFLGQIVGLTAVMAGVLVQYLSSYILMPLGYATMGLWFVGSNISLFGGKSPSGKVATFFLGLLGDFIPLLNIFLPGLTVWTITMIWHARREDKEEEKAAEVGYNNTKNWSRVKKTLRKYASRKNY
ncbi:hypothetical protein HY416_02795 [Candidatus Kaiserbacteria bacterium]|nr:hypothetical protein [Candidatus Kaiserbacteria bacterium]